ncbi:toll-like receptor 6 [Neocloeon triangulifer]|uniref:toll-like receptor 6 n=1 Tax=Neocloeon triangulifer TaxID=2078957 RepID=UPI00286EFAD5|nr:toll-like receptor 6 [Neocloeon triangulifer]
MQLLLLVLAAAAVAAASAARDSLRYEAPEDCQWSPRTSDEVALNCSLRTINSEFDHTNFSIIPAEHTTSLVVNCDSEVELKSTLPEDAFAHLIRLKELTLEQCKLPKWPSGSLQGLVDLRNLTIHTGNRKWPLEINAGSFKTIRLLEKLDLSQNNLWSLPEGLFCPLVSLVSLNVTHNRLQEIAELGFQVLDASESSTPPPKSRASCGLDVQVLEASHNNFEQLPAKGLGALRRLQELRVTDNEIKSVADKALAGLKNLKVFDVSNNKLVALPPGLFKDCVDIRELKLQNNSLGVLAPGLLAGLEHLQLLDLSRNRLSSTWLDSDTFSGLIRLVLLDISYNRITTLNPDFFKDLYTLQILNLEHNLIETLPADTFSPLSNLHTLVLSFNKLANVDPFSFNGLYALSLLSLDNNLFQTLHIDSLRNCTSLQDLNLNGNLLTNVPPALHDMRLLRTVDLGENSIEQLESPAFKGMDNLYGLRLIGNQISNLTRRSFADLPALQILNLARNNISKIEPSTFDANENLQAIRLDANLLSDMTGLFSKLPALVWLNVSDNQLSWFDYSLVPAGLEYLDLHENKIKEISNAKRRDTNTALKLIKLDVSHNLLTRVGQNSLPNSVELVLLNNNQITTVDVHTFVNKPNLTRVDLYANQIVNMDLNALRLTPVKEERPLPEFYIGGNPFQCDCTMEWLQRINNLDHLRQHPKVMDIESVYCRLPYARDKSFISLIDADSSHFVCAYKTHCFALCHCCDFDACDCEMTCPNNCTCYHDQSWSAANIVDCSLANHVRIPGTIPMDATEVYLDGNSFGELSSHSFIGRKNLRVLYVNGSRVNAIYNHTFSGLRRLEILHLEDNLLKEIKGFELQCLVELKELYLQNNKLQYLDNRTLMELKKLEVVRLDGNRLHNYPVWQLSFNNYLVRITLADNNWSCHCQYMRHFRTWLQQNLAKVSDAARISCVLRVKNEGESISKQLGPKFTDFNNTACSSMLIGGEFLDSEFDQSVTIRALRDYLPFALALLVAVTVASCLIFMAAYHRRELRLWMYSRCGVRLCYRSNANGSVVDEDTNRLFDAYIAYSLKDETWVLQMLATGLEPQYHLCLHYRNFSASSYVADTILEAVESSRRTVLILSPQFLTSEWARFDYKSAMREALQREARKSKKSPRRLIVIFLTDVPSRDLDPDLRMYLNSAALVLKYGDRRFWEKLRSALPAPRTGKNEDPKPRNGTLCCCAAKQEPSAAGARALHLDTSRVVYEYSSMVGPPPPLPDAYEQIGPPSTYHTLRREPPARDLWA